MSWGRGGKRPVCVETAEQHTTNNSKQTANNKQQRREQRIESVGKHGTVVVSGSRRCGAVFITRVIPKHGHVQRVVFGQGRLNGVLLQSGFPNAGNVVHPRRIPCRSRRGRAVVVKIHAF